MTSCHHVRRFPARLLLVTFCPFAQLIVLHLGVCAFSLTGFPQDRTIPSVSDSAATIERTSSLSEMFTFWIKDFKMNHQAEINTLNITIHYSYVAGISEYRYPDFRLIARDVQDFLASYPNKVDYWELVNKRLTLMVMRKYLVLSTVTAEIQVSPSSLDPYLRASIVSRTRSDALKQPDKKHRAKTKRIH